ncbi:MAG: hypothetical protein GX464_00220 [Holophagae bacterium]|nr:hypothetical protein [Holophagae bacterium]
MTVLVVVLLAAAGLAVWAVGKAREANEYFAAGHRAGPWLAGLAGTAAAVSGFTFVGGPGLFLVAGVGSLWLILSAPFTGALQCWVVGERVVEDRPDRPITVPELLQHQLGGRSVRAVAAVAVLVGCVASLAVQARAAAVLGETFLRLDGWLTAAIVMLAITTYTAAGGMRAGLLADAVQGGVMALVAVGLAGAALAAAGGPLAAIDTLTAKRPELLGAFGSFEPGRAASLYLLFALGPLAQPHYVQKFFFLRRRTDLRQLPAVLTGALAAMLALWFGVGLAGTALQAEGRITVNRPDELAPHVMTLLGPWAVLLAGVAVLAAMMSTAASFLNLAAAAVTRDLPAAAGRASSGVGTARWVTVATAAAATVLGVGSDRAVAWLGIAGWGFFTAALLPVVALGLAWPLCRPAPAAAAIAAGALVDLVLELSRAHLPAAVEPGLAGAAAGALVLVVGSFCSRLAGPTTASLARTARSPRR